MYVTRARYSDLSVLIWPELLWQLSHSFVILAMMMIIMMMAVGGGVCIKLSTSDTLLLCVCGTDGMAPKTNCLANVEGGDDSDDVRDHSIAYVDYCSIMGNFCIVGQFLALQLKSQSRAKQIKAKQNETKQNKTSQLSHCGSIAALVTGAKLYPKLCICLSVSLWICMLVCVCVY